MTPATGSSVPGAVTAAPRAKGASDNPALNALLSVYGPLTAPADLLFLRSNSAAPLGFEFVSGNAIPVVAALPGAPTNLQEVYLQIDVANAVWAHLIYDAGSASPYKWVCLGGSWLSSDVAAAGTTNSNVYGGLAGAASPAVNVLAGDWDVELSASAFQTVGAGAVRMSYDIGVTGAVDADGGVIEPATANTTATLFRSRRKTFVAPATLTARYRVGAGQATISNACLRARPVRLA